MRKYLPRAFPALRAHPWLVALVCVNLVILAAWLWSRDGQTTILRVEVNGGHFRATVDGNVLIDRDIDAPANGGIELRLDPVALPSLPGPRGFDRITVKDLADGRVLLEDDFSDPEATLAAWSKTERASIRDGLLQATDVTTILTAGDQTWRDYEVEVVLRNVSGLRVEVRNQRDGGASFSSRPYRHLDAGLSVERDGQARERFSAPPLELDEVETLRGIVAMLLRPYPYAVAAIAALALVAAASIVAAQRLGTPRISPPKFLASAPILVVVAGAFAAALYVMLTYYEGVPHVPDELSYLRQAQVLASGRFSAPVPMSPDSFQFFYPPFDVIQDGKWASIYPFGHPLMLAPAVGLGVPWLLPPLLGAACVALVYMLGREVYGARTGLIAATLLAVSPFFLMTASNFMSHNTAALFLLAAVLSLHRSEKQPVLYGILCGVFVGLLFNTRPLTGLIVAIPLGAMLLLGLLQARLSRKDALIRIAATAAGGLAMLLLYFGYEYLTSGAVLSLADNQTGDEVFGFSGEHSLARGLSNELAQLSFLVLVAHNWPVELGLALALLPFALLTRRRWDWFLGALCLCLIGAYTLYAINGIMHGPRFWYEALPFLMLLTARGIEVLAASLTTLVSKVRAAAPEDSLRAESYLRSVAVAGVLLLALYGSYGWLLGDGADWRADVVPNRAEALTNFNGLRPDFARTLEEQDLDNAIVLIEDCANWQCYGSVYLENNVFLDGEVVFAKDRAQLNHNLLMAYPDRQVYAAKYPNPEVLPYGGRVEAPLARDLATEFPAAAVDPRIASDDPRAVEVRDRRRHQDLTVIADAIQRYYDVTGFLPEVRSIQSLCIFPGDAACALRTVLDPLPADPLAGKTYWYHGEGDSFILYASLEAETGDGCYEIPPHIARERNVICLPGRVSRSSLPP